jgi:hypothetical protein
MVTESAYKSTDDGGFEQISHACTLAIHELRAYCAGVEKVGVVLVGLSRIRDSVNVGA